MYALNTPPRSVVAPCFLPRTMASSLPPNGPSSTIRAHAQANDILQSDAAKGNVAVHSFDPDASPAEKAAAAGKARPKPNTASLENSNSGGRGMSIPYSVSFSISTSLFQRSLSTPETLVYSRQSPSRTQMRNSPQIPLNRFQVTSPLRRFPGFPTGTKSAGGRSPISISHWRTRIRSSFVS